MAQTQAAQVVQTGQHHLSHSEWQALEQDAAFKDLAQRRNAFIIPSTLFFLGEYIAFLVVVGYLPDLANTQVLGVNVAYLLALLQFVVTWGMIALYVNRARGFDALAANVVAKADGHQQAGIGGQN